MNQTEKKCKIENCKNLYECKGYCGSHYHKWRKYGDPLAKVPCGGPRKPRFKKICLECKNEFFVLPSRNNERKKYCSKKCLHKNTFKYIPKPKPIEERIWYEPKKNGYLGMSCKGKMIWQHRYIMEKKIGRKLNDNEVVHHINGIKNDNREENLIIYTKSEHSRKHKEIFNELLALRKENEILKQKIGKRT